ncbi:MAG: HepT-like ribonuclease domain-containing protein [Candidatus Bathyarchaeia archaeon]
MRVIERLDKQANLIVELVGELEQEKGYRGIERLVQLVIQALLDLGLMVIAALNGKTPGTYSEVGEALQNLNMLTEGDANLLRSMAGMRNLLVHAYAAVRRGLITDAKGKLMADAPRIAKALMKGLESKALDPPSLTDNFECLREVLKGKVKVAVLFGGRAKGYQMKGDYDIAIYFGRSYDLYEVGGLVVNMARALKVSEEEVDVLVMDSAEPNLVLEALEGKRIYAEDQYVLFEVKTKALIKHLDMQSWLHHISK